MVGHIRVHTTNSVPPAIALFLARSIGGMKRARMGSGLLRTLSHSPGRFPFRRPSCFHHFLQSLPASCRHAHSSFFIDAAAGLLSLLPGGMETLHRLRDPSSGPRGHPASTITGLRRGLTAAKRCLGAILTSDFCDFDINSSRRRVLLWSCCDLYKTQRGFRSYDAGLFF